MIGEVLVDDEWSVHCEPQDPAEPQKGLIVYVKDGSNGKQEVSRVAYGRGGTKNPKAKFDEQLQQEIDLAQVVANTANEHSTVSEDEWSVVCWPVERDRSQPKNDGGIVVAVARGDFHDPPEDWEVSLVSRVAFKRRNAKLADVEFETQLRREVELAQTVADTLNSHHKRIHV